MVGSESTWVSHGPGYEVVGRTRGDLVLTHATLERVSGTMRRLFPADSLATLVVRVRRLPPDGEPFLPAPTLLPDERRPTVEMVIADPRAKQKGGDERGRLRMFSQRDPALPVVRAWLSARATQRTHVATHAAQSSGDAPDHRIPDWASEMIVALQQDSLVDRAAVSLASHPDAFIPLDHFFTMPEPLPDAPNARDEGTRAGRGVPSGGMRGGMGGGMGGGGRGGRGGGRTENPRGNEGERAATPLGEGTAYSDEAITLGRYLSREGYDFIGAIIDAQIAGQTVAEALAKKQFALAQVERDYRFWLNEHASVVK